MGRSYDWRIAGSATADTWLRRIEIGEPRMDRTSRDNFTRIDQRIVPDQMDNLLADRFRVTFICLPCPLLEAEMVAVDSE